MKDKIVYQEKYKNPGLKINKERLPRMRHLNSGFRCVDAFILNGGVIEKDGEEMEFQEIRVYLNGRSHD